LGNGISFKNENDRWDFEAVSPTCEEGEFSQVMAEMIGSTEIIEYRIAEKFQAKVSAMFGLLNDTVWKTTAEYGGGATLNKDESLTGNIQIFVHPRGEDIAWERLFNHKYKSSDGKSLDFTPEQVDAHEYGHAYNAIKWKIRVENPSPALRLENIIRARQKSPQRRLFH